MWGCGLLLVLIGQVSARPDVICPDLAVFGAEFADCDGNYSITDETVEWAEERPVYAHQEKDRYIFWNAGGLGWSIGKKDYLSSGSHWHQSGLDTKEPWEGAWENDVRVECVGKSAVDCLWSGFTGWSRCSSTCGVGLQRRQRKVLQPPQGGGNICQGKNEETRACQAAPCPVHCQWGNYGVWTKCSKTCGGGTRTRRRKIAKPALVGGRDCAGDKEEVQFCQTEPCPGRESNLVEQGRAIQGDQSRCCKKVRVSSTGRARIDQALYMGDYTRMARDFNGHAVYKREGNDVLYIYFFTSRRDQLSLWVIGPQLGQFIAGVRNSKTGACVHDLRTGWKYASRAGVWEDNDPSLSIECNEDSKAQQQFESRKTALTTTTEADIFSEVFEDTNPTSPKNCVWTTYGPWSECSKSCGRGNQIRVRRVFQKATGGGRACRGGNRERRICNSVSCPRNESNRLKTTTRRTTTTTRRTTTTTRKTTTTTEQTRSTKRATTNIRTTTSVQIRRQITATSTTTTRKTTRKSNFKPLLPKNKFKDRIQCWVCGSLFSTDAPDCPSFNKSDPAQIKTCDIGEACLFYSWTKSNSDTAVIRECFPTSILLGSIDNPVEPTPECSPIPVESENIQACICVTDFCSGIETKSEQKKESTALVRTTTHTPVRRTPSTKPSQRRGGRERVRCHQCGSLFSSNSPNPDCKRFDKSDPLQQGYCGQGEACLWYSWKKNPTSTAYVRECFSTSILLGSIDQPLTASSTCIPQDISESSESRISACLCDSDFCNSYRDSGEKESDVLPVHRLPQNDPIPLRPERPTQETPRRQGGAGEQRRRNQNFHPDKPGLQCYSCGSLLNPNKKCDAFDRMDSSQVQTCLTDEACLMYTWKKSASERATLRECFPTRVLLGSISDPLVPLPDCNQRDITDTGSGTIFACLCNSDFCNDSQENRLALGEGRRTTRRPRPTTRRTVPPRRQPPTTELNIPRSAPQRRTTTSSRSGFPPRQQGQLSCPPDFELVGGSCYFISDDRVGWIEARKMCELRGARLLSLETETERIKVVELIERQTRRRRSEYWLSGNDIETEGVWEWAKTRTPVADFGWIEEPFNSPEENCLAWTVTVSRSSSASDGWHSSSCCNNLRFICQL